MNLKFKKCEIKEEIKTYLYHSHHCSVIITFVSIFPQIIFLSVRLHMPGIPMMSLHDVRVLGR